MDVLSVMAVASAMIAAYLVGRVNGRKVSERLADEALRTTEDAVRTAEDACEKLCEALEIAADYREMLEELMGGDR